MLDSAEILLVRRLRAGDIDALTPLYERSADPLRAFCKSLVRDCDGAQRAADGAFAFAVERLAAQGVTPREFRSLLLGEARARCYDEIAASLGGKQCPEADRLDLDLLRRRLMNVRPVEPKGSSLAMRANSKLTLGKAFAVACMMVLMIDLFAAGYPLPRIFGGHDKKQDNTPAAVAPVAASVAAKRAVAGRSAAGSVKRAHHRAAGKGPASGGKNTASSPSSGSQGGQTASSGGGSNGSSGSNGLPVKVPVDPPSANVKVDTPELPSLPVQTPQVDANVDAGPINVDANVNATKPSASVCVTSVCINANK